MCSFHSRHTWRTRQWVFFVFVFFPSFYVLVFCRLLFHTATHDDCLSFWVNPFTENCECVTASVDRLPESYKLMC
jgi:hypothetical protein